MSLPLKIAVIGAGPAGCMVTRLLHNAQIPVVVYEAEAAPRMEGGSLDLHTETGLAAMRKAGLYEDFLKFARFDGESIKITDKDLVTLVDAGGTSEKDSRGRPEIDRIQLRRILLDSLPKDAIKWGHKLRKIDNDLTLHFDHGVESGFDLVIGCDGTWSKVRQLVSDTVPHYSGISGYVFGLEDAEHNDPEIYKLIRRGSVFAFGYSRAILAQQMSSGVINTGAWITTSNTQGHENETEIKKYLTKEYADWNPDLLRLVNHPKSTNFVFRPLYMLPVGHRWKHKPGVTVIGDASHVMTPFAGEGVNLALEDAMKLAEAVIEAVKQIKDGHDKLGALSGNVKQFEEEMFIRAPKTQQRTVDMQNAMFFTHGAPWTTIEKYVCTAMTDEVPRLAHPLLAVVVYTYFFFLKLWKGPKAVV